MLVTRSKPNFLYSFDSNITTILFASHNLADFLLGLSDTKRDTKKVKLGKSGAFMRPL